MNYLKLNLLVALLCIISSCTKDDILTEETSIDNKVFKSNNANMPYVENGILFFNSKDHVNDYYNYLDEMINTKLAELDAINNPQDETDVDDILDQYEAQFGGFTSYRKLFNQLHNFKEQGHSKNEIMEVFENDYVAGYEKSYVNTNLELGIGNKIYVYHSQDIIIAFDKNNQELLSELRTIEKGTGDLPTTILMEYEQEIQLISNNNIIETKMHLVVDCGLSYDSAPILQNLDCDVYNKGIGMSLQEEIKDYECNEILSYMGYSDAFANITINWGDGSTNTTTTFSTFSNQLLWHTYTSMGTYNATVTITFIDADGNLQTMSDPVTVVVADACAETNGTVSGTVNDGSWMLVGTLTVSNGFFGANRIEGKTLAFKSCGSGCWTMESKRSRKPYNKVYIRGTFRDSNCAYKSFKEGSGISNHANEKTKIKTKYWKRYDHSNGDVRSEHRVIKGASSLALDLVYNPC